MKTIQSGKTNLYIKNLNKTDVSFTDKFENAMDFSKDTLAWFKLIVLKRRLNDETLHFHNFLFFHAAISTDVRLSLRDIWNILKTEWKKEAEKINK